MLAATTKIGSKYLVHIEILKALGTELENLPEKEKVMFDFKSAVVFLRPFLEPRFFKSWAKSAGTSLKTLSNTSGASLLLRKKPPTKRNLTLSLPGKKRANMLTLPSGRMNINRRKQWTLFLLLMRHNHREANFQTLKHKISMPRKMKHKLPQMKILTRRNLPQILRNKTAHISFCHLIRRIYKHANTR